MGLLTVDGVVTVENTDAKDKPQNAGDLAAPPVKTVFRNYVDSAAQSRVENFYHLQHKNQSYEWAKAKREDMGKLNKLEMSLWDAALLLNEIVDDSDPDTDDAQIVHLLQTAESIRRKFPGEEYDWFHLTGFIHDLGKILAHPKVFNEPQWAVVGDSHPLGCEFATEIVFQQYLPENPDYNNPKYNTKFGVYHEGVGLENVVFTYGHDEYMYQVCVGNKSTLPLEALYVIRFHSFYPWHNKGAYDHLCNDQDRAMLKWVKEFQLHDLYSKLPEKIDVQALLPYYKGLMAKYFPAVCRW
jgi:inositol oxygenase